MTNLSIIIISYNTKDITKKCLETVIESLSHDPSIKAEIMVLDNASTDGSVEMLEAFRMLHVTRYTPVLSAVEGLHVKIIQSKSNLGFSGGNNHAVKEATGKYLLFLNSDIEVLDDAIPRLYNFFTNQDKFQFVGGKLLEKDVTTPQPSCGPFYSLPIVFTALFLRGDYWGATRSSPDKLKEADWVSGACIMCQKADFASITGFDENIFMYMEEIDLLYRAKKKQMATGFYPDARFIHLGSASAKSRKEPILQVYKGFLYFYKKHHSKMQLQILKIMLKLKAEVALLIGRISRNAYLINTYEEAEKLV